jgi:hypothetical protein
MANLPNGWGHTPKVVELAYDRHGLAFYVYYPVSEPKTDFCLPLLDRMRLERFELDPP